MILVDTSVWIDHFRRGDRGLSGLLDEDAVLCHPFIIGELACGNLKNRAEILSLLGALPTSVIATHEEALKLLADRELAGMGLGWFDVHLLASALLSGSALWTRDKVLVTAAVALGAGLPAGG